MGSNYLISRKWAFASRFVITDESGGPQFEVRGRFAPGAKLSVYDVTGTEVAVISRRGMGRRYQIGRRPGDHRDCPRVPRQSL